MSYFNYSSSIPLLRKLGLFLLLVGFTFSLLPNSHVTAYSNNKLIEDSTFLNASSMSASQIQAFLSAKGSALANMLVVEKSVSESLSYYPHFNQSVYVAQAIYDAAQVYGLNPQVILATLQKEQSLVTDPAPSASQFRYAMGYGCPDSVGCGDASAGLFYQIDNGTWDLRFLRERANGNGNWWKSSIPYPCAGSNKTYYSPGLYSNNTVSFYDDNNSVSVNPRAAYASFIVGNSSTAALYCYTPHAYNNPSGLYGNPAYGTTGQYYSGSFNFVKSFEQWFGPTVLSGIKPSNQSTYATTSCTPPILQPNDVARLYNPDTQDYLLTTNPVEACVAIGIGYIWDGVTFKSITPTTPDAIPIYRLSGYGRHIYTSSDSVKSYYLSAGYQSEGISFYALTSTSAGTSTVYCLVKGDSVVYTTSGGELTSLQAEGYNSLGAAFYTPTISQPQTSTRFVDTAQRRFYTANPTEKPYLSSFGYSQESNYNFSASLLPDNNNKPVYRLRDTRGNFFYTESRLERDLAVINYGYRSDGIGFYVYDVSPSDKAQDIPVYRLTDYKGGYRVFTTSAVERDLAVSRYGYTYEGIAWYALPTATAN